MNEIDRLWEWDDFIRFQNKIAERWFKRGNEAIDPFSKFFFFFSGFNALYFLWKKVDGVDEGAEGKQIEHLLNKFGEPEAKEILASTRASIDYFAQRNPILRIVICHTLLHNISTILTYTSMLHRVFCP